MSNLYNPPRNASQHVRFHEDSSTSRRPPHNIDTLKSPILGFPQRYQGPYKGNNRSQEPHRGPQTGQSSYPRAEEKKIQEPDSSLASIIDPLAATQAQQAATQAQQEKDTHSFLQQLKQMKAHNKMLETQIVQ